MRVAISCVLATIASGAHAQPNPAANAHAKHGVALYNLGKYEESIAEFELAYQEFQSDALLFNLAQAHRKLEHCERALTYYHQFLAGTPAPALAQQVEKLLPELEAACRTRDARPEGPVTQAALETRPVIDAPPASEVSAEEPSPDLHVGAELVVGEVISGGNAPVTGVRATATMRPAWLYGDELGLALGAGELWRSEAMQRATIVQLAATIEHRASYEWGRLTASGELGAELVSLLGGSRDVVPGVGRASQWAPLVRGEVGIEHDVSHLFAVRAAIAASICPKIGALDAAVGELDLAIGLRYTP